MGGLRVMEARRKRLVLDEAELEDPIAGTPARGERDGEPPEPPIAKSSTGRTREPSTQRAAPAPHAPAESRAAAELLAGKSEQVAVRLDDDLWARVVELAEGVNARGGHRASTTAVLATALAFACPEGEVEALDLVARRELELTDRRQVGRSEHNVRLPAQLRRRLDELAKAVRAAGFPGGRSALVNAILALRAPADAQAAAEQLDRLRRARAAAFVQPEDAGAGEPPGLGGRDRHVWPRTT